MSTIAIVDYGMGNFHSVARALAHAAPDADIRICNQPGQIAAADRVVFPGQGAMADCMRTLDESGLRESVLRAAREKPLLGVCVGEQMLFDRSEEGDTPGLSIFSGTVRRFTGPQFAEPVADDGAACAATDAVNTANADGPQTSATAATTATAAASTAASTDMNTNTAGTDHGERLKVPHMGWNRVRQTRAHALWHDIPDGTHFYFVHSYYADPANAGLTVGASDYGIAFTCAVAADNIFAVQFHPEKSATHGLRLYRNFVDWNP